MYRAAEYPRLGVLTCARGMTNRMGVRVDRDVTCGTGEESQEILKVVFFLVECLPYMYGNIILITEPCAKLAMRFLKSQRG